MYNNNITYQIYNIVSALHYYAIHIILNRLLKIHPIYTPTFLQFLLVFLRSFNHFFVLKTFSFYFKTYYFSCSKQSLMIFFFESFVNYGSYILAYDNCRKPSFPFCFKTKRGGNSGLMLLFDSSFHKFGISNLKFHIVFHLAI